MLEARDIGFSWGGAPLLNGAAFAVAPGETAALVGANGAGKSTLLKILAGLIEPGEGSVRLDGTDISANPLRYRRMLGYLSERAAAEPDMKVRAYLKHRAHLRGEMAKKIRHRVAEAMSLCALEAYGEEYIGRLSFGLRKRVALADALLLRPRILLLDDLLAGLDPATRRSFGRILSSVSSFASVVVSGHELDELAAAATKFLVLRGGTVKEVANASAARAELGVAPPPKGGAA